MKLIFGLLTILSIVCARAQVIETRALDAAKPMRVALSQGAYTTLRFPAKVNGFRCLGAVQFSNGQVAGTGKETVAIENSKDSPLLSLHGLKDDVHAWLTVTIGEQEFLIELVASDIWDAIVKYVSGDGKGDQSSEPHPVSPQQVKADRPVMNEALYRDYERRALETEVRKPQHPEDYLGYQSRPAHYESGESLKTVVTQICRFDPVDMIVLRGSVTNNGEKPATFEGRSAEVMVASESHPIKWLDCKRPIAPGETTEFVAIIQGAVDGFSRANLGIGNEFRLGLTQTGVQPSASWSPSIPRYGSGTIPRTQTGAPVRNQ